MSIKQIIPVSGSWFVMMRDQEDAASQPHAVRVAAWAVLDVDDGGTEVHPLIAPYDAGNLMNQLFVPDAEDVIGIADDDQSREGYWADLAKQSADADVVAELRDMATYENAEKAIKRIVALGYTPKVIADQLVALDQHQPYMVDEKFLHALSEANLIDSVQGGWITTPLGDIVIKKNR